MVGIVEQTFQRPQTEDFIEHLGGDLFALERVQ